MNSCELKNLARCTKKKNEKIAEIDEEKKDRVGRETNRTDLGGKLEES